MHLVSIVFIIAVEFGVLDTLFCMRIERKSYFGVRVALCAGLLVLYAVCVPLEKMRVFFHLPIILISFLYIGLCYRNTFRTTLYLGIASYSVQRIASMLNSLVTLVLPDQFGHLNSTSSEVRLWSYAIIVLCDAVVFFTAYFVIIRHMQHINIGKQATAQVLLLTGIVLTVNQITSITIDLYGDVYSTTVTSMIEYIWSITSCVLCLFVQFGIRSVSEKDRALEVTKKIIAEKEQQYKLSKSNIDAINRKCHDLKYQLAALQRDGDKQKHIDEAMQLVDSFDSAIHTGNDTLDVIFTEKNDYCKKHDITFVCMIDGAKLNFMEVTDQYVMFGNIIDNAIHAVRKIEDHAKRSIYIDVHAEKKLLLLRTENPFVGELTFSDGLPRTTTGDEFNHGFGMTSIRLIAEKYGGSVNTRAEDGIFYLNVLFPIK